MDDAAVEKNSPGRPNKYKRIFEQLQQAISEGIYGVGQRIPSEMQLSRTCGASRLTVARALRDLEALGIIERRPGSGSYVRERARLQSRTFGLLIPELGQTEIFEPICQGMARASRATHDELLWGAATHDVESQEQQVLQLSKYYISKDVSGVFFAPLEYAPHRLEINMRILEDFQKNHIPVVLLDRDVCSYPHRSDCDLVGIDNRRAGSLVTEHLIRQGCQRVVFFGWPNSAATIDQRIAGYRDAVRQAEYPELIEVGDAESRESIAKVLTKHRPDGFVCANDRTAGQIMVRLNELGVEIPAKMKITGIDDAKYASFLHVPLTTVRQPCHEIGAAAVWTMIDRIEHPNMPARDIFLNCQLIVRRSCGSR